MGWNLGMSKFRSQRMEKYKAYSTVSVVAATTTSMLGSRPKSLKDLSYVTEICKSLHCSFIDVGRLRRTRMLVVNIPQDG